jgi:hypothetical protein
MRRSIYHIQKRVPECLMLRNHSIIFSSVDFKEEAKYERHIRNVPSFNRPRQGETFHKKLHEVSRDRKVWPN